MKVGVIGTGKMGENHVRTYLELKENCELIGVYDNDEKRCRKIAEKYGIRAFPTMFDLLDEAEAVSIAVPTAFHYEVGLACIDANTHMIMEKPITDNVDKAEDLIEKAQKAQLKIHVGHIELFNPLIRILKKELENENIIGISCMRLNPSDERVKNVDVVQDLMIHDLYILKELLEDEFINFHAIGNGIDDITKHATVIIESSKGVIGELTASFKSYRRIRTIQIFTDQALIEADLLKHSIAITKRTIIDVEGISVPITKFIHIDDTLQPLNIQLLSFINSIKEDKLPKVSGEHGKWALQMTEKVRKLIHKS